MDCYCNAKKRIGAWTEEEKNYRDGLIQEFEDGSLDIPNGASLRCYLAEQLQCCVKRISKKMEGTGYPGRKKFCAATFTQQELKTRMENLSKLRSAFSESVKARESHSAVLSKDTGKDNKDQKGIGQLGLSETSFCPWPSAPAPTNRIGTSQSLQLGSIALHSQPLAQLASQGLYRSFQGSQSSLQSLLAPKETSNQFLVMPLMPTVVEIEERALREQRLSHQLLSRSTVNMGDLPLSGSRSNRLASILASTVSYLAPQRRTNEEMLASLLSDVEAMGQPYKRPRFF